MPVDERRRHERWKCEGPVRIQVGDSVDTGQMLEMSPGNCWLTCPVRHPLGTILQLRFRHPEDGRTVVAEAMVMRNVPLQDQPDLGFGMAAEFVKRPRHPDSGEIEVISVELDEASAEFEISVEMDASSENEHEHAVEHEFSVEVELDVPEHRIRPARETPPLPVPLKFWSGDTDDALGFLEEVSLGGVRVSCEAPPAEGRIVNLRMLPGDGDPCPPVTVLGMVVWSRDAGFGVEIRDAFDPAETAAWKEYARAFFL